MIFNLENNLIRIYIRKFNHTLNKNKYQGKILIWMNLLVYLMILVLEVILRFLILKKYVDIINFNIVCNLLNNILK